MSSSPKSPGSPEPKEDLWHEIDPLESEDSAVDASVRETASRIPQELSEIGREISRTIERAIAQEDQYVLAFRVSYDTQVKLEEMVQVGVFRTRSEAAAFLIDEGIKSQEPLLKRVEAKLAEIERLRAELRVLIEEESATRTTSTTMTRDSSQRTREHWDQTFPDWLVGLSENQLGTGLLLVKQPGSDQRQKINRSNIAYSQFKAYAVGQQAIAIKWVPHTIADETTILSIKCHGYCQATCVVPGCICDNDSHQCS